MPSGLDAAMAAAGALAREAIDGALADCGDQVAEAMRYATTGGKFFRAFLAAESGRLHGLENREIKPVAGAIECIHGYSLIHDDLPAMDDDDLRRGRPTVHKKWDEATAILAGDALQTLAYQLLAEADGLESGQKISLIEGLARASGIVGMVGGQEMDIAAERRASPMPIDEIYRLQAAKTGALISWAATVGPVIASSDVGPLKTYGDAVGLSFQIADDILDVEGSAAVVGKATGKDDTRGKATFVSMLGLEEARQKAKRLAEQAIDALDCYGEDADLLREMARFTVSRNK